MARFWSSDWHFGHARIAEFCPGRMTLGDSIEARDDALVRRINEQVSPDDDLWVLGDIAMGSIAYSLPVVSRIHANLFLVPGNHDRCWIGDRRHDKWMERYEEVGFTILPEQSQTEIAGYTVNICHFPYEGDSHGEDRHGAYRMTDDGVTPIVHGHVHDDFRVKGRQFNVGVDANDYNVVSDATLAEWVRSL